MSEVVIAPPAASPGRMLRDLVALTKPGVTAVLVFTAITTAWAASGPWVSWERLLLLLLAGGLASSGAAALNQYLERDLDALMPRTARRPLPAGRLPQPKLALGWGILLLVAGLGLSARTLPVQTTLLIALGVVIYILLYTRVLKRLTRWGVVIGGAAGCCPILAGWSVVRADWPIMPFALAALVFFWTPAHFWAYALVHHESYRRSGFPMLPTIVGMRVTPFYMLAHTLPMALLPLVGLTGIPLWIAMGTGALLLGLNVALIWHPTTQLAWRFYKASNVYLVLVFLGLLCGV